MWSSNVLCCFHEVCFLIPFHNFLSSDTLTLKCIKLCKRALPKRITLLEHWLGVNSSTGNGYFLQQPFVFCYCNIPVGQIGFTRSLSTHVAMTLSQMQEQRNVCYSCYDMPEKKKSKDIKRKTTDVFKNFTWFFSTRPYHWRSWRQSITTARLFWHWNDKLHNAQACLHQNNTDQRACAG